MKALKSQYKEASKEVRISLAQLTSIFQKQIRVLHLAERRQRERACKRAAFIINPFKFTKELLGQKSSGRLVCSKEEINQHLKQTYSDPEREQELVECAVLIDPPELDVQFNMSQLKPKKV